MVHANIDGDYKHQILLPRHKLTDLIVTNEHIKLLHCGHAQLLNSIRERYWPVHGRNLVKAISHKCVTCAKLNAKAYVQKMGNLPAVRLTPSAPFSHVGIDYFAPFKCIERRSRGYKSFKTYVCLFICMGTKAIHLEVVSDLTTQAFLAALRRFASRRGKPTCIYSDNATNFIGAKSEMQEIQSSLYKIEIECKDSLANEGISINWRYIPPRSPHHGGLWESHVKLIKKHLLRVVGNISLSWEELETILIQIEGIVNSRPLTPLSDDNNDLNPLTPAHFLIGRSITAVPDRKLLNIPENRLKNFEKLQKFTQDIWIRWKKEIYTYFNNDKSGKLATRKN